MPKKIHKLVYSVPVVYEAVKEGGYVVFAPTLPGCHSQGESLEEAEKNISEAIELYLEVLPKSERTNLSNARIFQASVKVEIKAYA